MLVKERKKAQVVGGVVSRGREAESQRAYKAKVRIFDFF